MVATVAVVFEWIGFVIACLGLLGALVIVVVGCLPRVELDLRYALLSLVVAVGGLFLLFLTVIVAQIWGGQWWWLLTGPLFLLAVLWKYSPLFDAVAEDFGGDDGDR